MNGPFLHGTPELEMKTQLLVNFAAEDGVRQHSKINDFDQERMRIRKRRKYKVKTIHDCFRHIFVKMILKSLFRPVKERRNEKPKTIQVIVCKVMRKRLHHTTYHIIPNHIVSYYFIPYIILCYLCTDLNDSASHGCGRSAMRRRARSASDKLWHWASELMTTVLVDRNKKQTQFM